MKQLNELKIFFMGTPQLAQDILRHLVEHAVPVQTVVTQPDRPFGRKKELRPSEVKVYAQQQEIPVVQFEKIDAEAMEFFRLEKPDLIIVAAYGIILPKALIELPQYGCVNVHMSLLPALRGASPIQTALWQGLTQTGTTIMLMDEKMDTGDILSQQAVAINEQDTFESLAGKLVDASLDLLIPTLQQWINKTLTPEKQDHAQATYAKILKKQDGLVNWQMPAKDTYHQYQALSHWPKLFAVWNEAGQKKITFWEIAYADTPDNSPRIPGEVFRDDNGRVAIQTAHGVIMPLQIQLEGKNPVAIQAFINGYPHFIGTVLH